MKLTKVWHLNGRTTVEWREGNGNDEQKSSLTHCADPPNKSFMEALAAVEHDLLRMSGQTSQAFKAAFSLTGFSVSRSGSGRRVFNATAFFEWGWGGKGESIAPLREGLDDDEGPSFISNTVLKHFDQLTAEALKYANAERQIQMDLPEEAVAE